MRWMLIQRTIFLVAVNEVAITDMKKGPNLRWSLIQCSGGDEGDRTPDLLTASQALSQLSYAPVRKSTIRELARRCKDNFEKLSAARGRTAGASPERPKRPAGRAPRAAATPPPSPPVPLGHSEARRPPSLAFGTRPATRAKTIRPPSGPIMGPKAFRPARPLQNHAGIRGWAENPRAPRNW